MAADNNPTKNNEAGACDEYKYVTVKERVKRYDDRICQPSDDTANCLSPSLAHAKCSATQHDEETSPLSAAPSYNYMEDTVPCKMHRYSSSSHCEDNRDLSALPVRIFVGTWNCVYQDIEESMIVKPVRKDQHLSHRITRSVVTLSHWLTHVFHRFGHEHFEHDKRHDGGQHSIPVGNQRSCKYCVTKRTGRIHSTGCVSAAYSDNFDVAACETCHRDKARKDFSHVSDDKSERRLIIDYMHNDINLKGAVDATAKTYIASLMGVLPPQAETPLHCVTPSTTGDTDEVDPHTGIHGSGGCIKGHGIDDNIKVRTPFIDNSDWSESTNSISPPETQMALRYVLRNTEPALTVRRSTMQLKPLTEEDGEPLHDWIQTGYDVYIIALQETLSSSIFTSITKYLQRHSEDDFERVPLEEYKISGYGDGAFLHMKSTSIAVWVKKSLLTSGKAKIVKSKVIPLSVINRSKGVVTFQMNVLGQKIGVVGCHMPTRYHEREKAAAYILKKLPEVYGGAGASLKDVFHHVLWTGDFNFRVGDISAQNALDLLNNNMRDQLFSYDEFNRGRALTLHSMNFVEGEVRFFPTYKKRDDRDVVDRSRSNWADEEYHTRYATQWYKGRNIKERVPSWTDRVLKWSVPDLHNCLIIDDDSYRAAQPSVKNILLASDHSPVGCGLVMWPSRSSVLGKGNNLDTTTS